VTEYRLVAEPRVDLDVGAAFAWYENEQIGLGLDFKYQDLRSGIRRALLRRFPYAVYFAVETDVVVVLAVLHVSRDPAEWQRRRG